MTKKGIVEQSHYLAHPITKVWECITTPALLAAWWAKGDIRPEVGHHFTLDMGQWGLQPCEVLAVEAPHLIKFSFAPGTLDTTISFRLTEEGVGTRLDLRHENFDLTSPLGQAAYKGMGGGWPKVLSRIDGVLAAASLP